MWLPTVCIIASEEAVASHGQLHPVRYCFLLLGTHNSVGYTSMDLNITSKSIKSLFDADSSISI